MNRCRFEFLFRLAAVRGDKIADRVGAFELAGVRIETKPDELVEVGAPLAQKIGLRRLMTWVERFDRLRARLRININRQIATEATLLTLGETPG